MMIETITKENFSEKIENANTPTLVELWAPWCGYCRRLSPVLDRVAAKRGDALPIGKINVDDEPELAEKLDASVIPTLYLYQNGARSEKLVAPASQAVLEEWIDKQVTH